jgi:hypothetical protein
MSEVKRTEVFCDNPAGLLVGEEVLALFTMRLTATESLAFGLKIPKDVRDAIRELTPENRASLLHGLDSLYAQLKREIKACQ